jgi:hypothetical protein
MKRTMPWIPVFAIIAIAGCFALLAGGAAGQSVRVGTSAPDIAGGPWIGSEPLTIAGLRGRVVLVEFWTYG